MYEHLVGHNLSHYRILSQIGETEQGTVFRAHDPNLQRDVAAIVIHPDLVGLPSFAENLYQNARWTARLDHPSLVKVYDFGQEGNYYFLVVEYIPGEDLAVMLRELKRRGLWINLGEAVGLVRQLALALDYIESQGGRPRLAVPSNIKIRPIEVGELPYLPVLTDLGLSQLSPVNSRTIKNPAYISPEDALGKPTDSRSSVYSLGVLLFELCTGQLPYPVESVEDAIRYHTRQPLPAPRSLRPDLPEGLEAVIMKALEKNHQARFATPGALANELDRLQPAASQVLSAPPALERAASLLEVYDSGGQNQAAFAEPAPTQAFPAEMDTVQRALVDVSLENSHLTVEPGSAVTTLINVTNRGRDDAVFTIDMEGLPSGWAALAPQNLRLRPGEKGTARLTIQPARTPQSRAGRYGFTVRAASKQDPGRMGETRGSLTVSVFSQFASRINSRRLRSTETAQITVTNQGNVQETYSFQFSDPQRALVFTPPETPLRLDEGQTGVAEFQPAVHRMRLVGAEEVLPFVVEVIPSNGETQTIPAEVVSYPLVPLWAAAIVALILLCLAGSIGVLASRSGMQATQATATVWAQQTQVAFLLQSTAQAETATSAAQTATALFLENANLATIQAVTATAAWQAADPDQDGLTNQQEADLGTRNDRADTDGDGLGDGDEVARQTDPLRPDTDGDGLSDGVEVANNLNPLSADTDSDGLADNVDPNPLQTSTPTLNPEATAAVAATQTAQAQATIVAFQNATATAQAATAAALSAQAATATAQAALIRTATAQAIATQTASASHRLVYFFLTNPTIANNYKTLLQQNRFVVDVLPLDAIGSVDNYGIYRAILLGPDTGSEGNWGDIGGQEAAALMATGLPIIGLGDGGYSFFVVAGVSQIWGARFTGDTSSVFVVDPLSPVWTDPYPINVPGDRNLQLYTSLSSFVAVEFALPPPDVVLIGRRTSNPQQYQIFRQGTRFLLWGFNVGPDMMNPDGMAAFLNCVEMFMP